MSQAVSKNTRPNLINELMFLEALSRVAGTDDGKMLIDFVLNSAKLSIDPHKAGKNSADTANILGRQLVGRALFDKLTQAGVKVGCSAFSKKKNNRIEEINIELKTI